VLLFTRVSSDEIYAWMDRRRHAVSSPAKTALTAEKTTKVPSLFPV
jgi:hypothetical protein